MPAIIATSEHLCQTGSGKRFTLSIALRAPVRQEGGPWACAVILDGLTDRERNIYGEDSLQALGLALALVREELQSFAQSGGRFLDPESGEAWAIDEYLNDFPSRHSG